jgi:hypothetical protein
VVGVKGEEASEWGLDCLAGQAPSNKQISNRETI